MDRSVINKVSYICPSCGGTGKFEMFFHVYSTDSNRRGKVLTGELFSRECPYCGELLHLKYNFDYEDIGHKFQIMYSPFECEDITNYMKELCPDDRYGIIKRSGKTFRTVDSLHALREKILVFEEGLDDIAIELSKVMMKKDKNFSIQANSELRFEKYMLNDESKGQLMFRHYIENHLQKDLIVYDKANYDVILDEVLSNEKYKKPIFYETIDEKWILARLM